MGKAKCPVCGVTASGEPNKLADEHFNLTVWCPVCWDKMTNTNSLIRHLKRKHADHPLNSLRSRIKRATGFYFAADPRHWNPEVKVKDDQVLLAEVKKLYRDVQDKPFPDKILMNCAENFEEAKARDLVLAVTHRPAEDVTTVSSQAAAPVPQQIRAVSPPEDALLALHPTGDERSFLSAGSGDIEETPSGTSGKNREETVKSGCVRQRSTSSVRASSDQEKKRQKVQGSGQEAQLKSVIARPFSHKQDRRIGQTTKDLKRRSAAPSSAPSRPYKFQLVAAKVLDSDPPIVRFFIVCHHKKPDEGMYHFDIEVESAVTVLSNLRTKLVPMKEIHQKLLNRELTTYQRCLSGDLADVAVKLASYLAIDHRQLNRVGLHVRPNAVEKERMGTTDFLVQELPTSGWELSGIFHLARQLHLKTYRPKEFGRKPVLFPESTTPKMLPLEVLMTLDSTQRALGTEEGEMEGSVTETTGMTSDVFGEQEDIAGCQESQGQQEQPSSASELTPGNKTSLVMPEAEEEPSKISQAGGLVGAFGALPTVRPFKEIDAASCTQSLPLSDVAQLRELTAKDLLERCGLDAETTRLECSTGDLSDGNGQEPLQKGAGPGTSSQPESPELTQSRARVVFTPEEITSPANRKRKLSSCAPVELRQQSSKEVDSHPMTVMKPQGSPDSPPEVSIMTAMRSKAVTPSGPVLLASSGQSQRLPRKEEILMYNRFVVPVAVTGDRCTRVTNCIMRADREQNPHGFKLLLPHGFYPLIRPARRDWRALGDGHIRVPLVEGDTAGIIWPPKGWQEKSGEERRDELLGLGQLLDLAWYGLQECRYDLDVAERYYAFTLPYSLGPDDKEFTSQAYSQDRFQATIRKQIRLHEVTARRLGLWHTFAPELYADEAAQETWDGLRTAQLPKPVRHALDLVPLFTFPWESQDVKGDEARL